MTGDPYPRYRPSGAEWLGDIPGHWEVKRIAALFSEVVEQGADNLPILSVSIHDGVSDKELDPEEMDRKVTRSDDRSKYKRVARGDLVYNMMRAWQGGFGAVETEGMVSPAYVVARPKGQLSARFTELLLRTPAAVEEMRRRSRGVTDFRLRLYWEEFKGIDVVVPPPSEQKAVLAFLQRETVKIDALVEEQKRLIDLLKEKRQAIISHAVIKGLNPDAPMKDSGIDWLGQVPEHWELTRLKRELDFLTSGSRGWADHYSDNGSLFIRIGNLTRDTTGLDLTDIQRVEVPRGSEGERTMVRGGDLLFSITAFLGSIAVVPPELETAYVSQHVALARLKPSALRPQWVAYVTLSDVGKTYLATQGYGGTKIQLSLSDVAMLPVPCPPTGEQDEILDFLESETLRFEQLANDAHMAIGLLNERRVALISAAVTGKIDVSSALRKEEAA
ncbi:restriction endonuclease subunit S [Rhizobium laguerreae]|uniref:restriction endonuclease subunit S n=1 Tax=Rhizobium laguerreae TaxID=1076926 RepID=UPI001441DD98|nr:restriction endonuclease subunit S [Rhizobium laguerreae]NKN13964.1 restriction endonuclease subunit S [Rhizobium laguerreae]